MTRAEFEAVWDGHVVLLTRRASLTDLARRFDITWFLGAIHKYRHMLGEVMLASFFLQIFALVSPLFFQIVIDKVLVHRSMSTLDVLLIGLGDHRRLRNRSGRPPDLPVLAYDQPDRRRIGRAPLQAPPRAADRLLPVAPCRRFRRASPRIGEHPQLPDQLGADDRHRHVLHVRLPGGDVPLLAVPDVDRAGLISVLYRHLCRGDAAVPPTPRREVPSRRREPGLPGRERVGCRDAEGHGGRAADAAPLGGAARRLRRRELSRPQPGQYDEPMRPARQQAGDGGGPVLRCQGSHRRQPQHRRARGIQHLRRTGKPAGPAAGPDLAGLPSGPAVGRAPGRHPQHDPRADVQLRPHRASADSGRCRLRARDVSLPHRWA